MHFSTHLQDAARLVWLAAITTVVEDWARAAIGVLVIGGLVVSLIWRGSAPSELTALGGIVLGYFFGRTLTNYQSPPPAAGQRVGKGK